ncbi:MAG: polymer-forming cytoskeletal protein [Actinobacteria bacterium]|nr:polymer-forming cytoskeletal protein [Actinomycetota bacterium]
MLLKTIGATYRRLAATGTREAGAALIGVLGVMGVSSAVAVTSTTMSLHAVGFTSSTRAGVQAEAAATAGIDFAAAKLAASTCQPEYSSTTSPIFTVKISYSTLATSPGDVDSSWVTGCPTNAGAARLRLISTGHAASFGVAGQSSQDVRRVEAIYPYTPTPASSSIVPSGAAMYAFSQVDPTINNLTLNQGSTTKPSIQYLSGSVTCTSHSVIKGDLILGNGSASVTSGCTIDGDLYATNDVSIVSGEVTGNVISHSANGLGYVNVAKPAIVDGDIYSSGSVSISGKVGGSIVVGPGVANSMFYARSSVGGSFVTAGTFSGAAASIKGTITTRKSGIVTPAIPTVPRWIDFSFNANEWLVSAGTPFATQTLSSCSSSNLANALRTAQNSAMPIIIDTRGCGANTDLRNIDLALTSDMLILANNFTLSSNTIASSNNTAKRLWIVIPDNVQDNTPTCPSGSSSIGNNVNVSTLVNAFVYSPCPISNSGDIWRGQMYASSISTSSPFTLSFVPIGLPNVNLSTGEVFSPPGTGVLGDRLTIRDVVIN